MADPVTLTAMGATAGASLMQAFGSIFEGESKAAAYKYQAGVARINKQIADQNASWARAKGETEAQTAGMRGRAEIGQAKAVQSGRGLDVTKGSPADVRESQLDITQQNEAIIRSNAARQAFGYEIEGMEKTAEGQLLEMAGSKSKTAGKIGAISSILGGAASVSGKWLSYKQSFGTGSSGFSHESGHIYDLGY